MDLNLRINIDLAKSTNYIPMGFWNEESDYYLSDIGIPFVKKPDGSTLGYSVYALIVEHATKGTWIASEWRLLESAEFIYMQQAYIEQLQFEAASGGGFEIEDGYFRSIAENTGGNPMIKLDGTDGSGHLAAGNISWDAAGNTEFKGKIDATKGVIGGFSIGPSSLVATNDDGVMLLSSDLIRFTGQYSEIAFGNNVLPVEANGDAINTPITITVNRPTPDQYVPYGNIGLWIDVTGVKQFDDAGMQYSGNNALYITRGTTVGFRPRVRRVNTSQTLSTLDTVIFCVAQSAKITLTLPTNAENGQIYFIKKATSPDFVVTAGGGDYIMTNSSTKSITVSNKHLIILIYDKVNGLWMFGLANE